MTIHGREIKFKLTIGAQQRIAAMCPDGDIKKLDEITKSGDVVAGIAAVVEMIAALSEGHERARQYEQPEYEPNPLTVDEILTLERDEIIELQQEAWRALKIGSKQQIKAEAAKKKGGARRAGPDELTTPWLIYYGHTFGMDRREIMVTEYGEMLDMIACSLIMKGVLRPVRRRKMSIDDAAKLR